MARALHLPTSPPPALSTAGCLACRSPEEAVVQVLLEARRAAPSILYLPHVGLWWATAPQSLRTTLQMVLADLPAELPIALIASCEEPCAELDAEVRAVSRLPAA